MSGLGGLNKSPNGVVLGMVQLQLPNVVTEVDLATQTQVIVDMVGDSNLNIYFEGNSDPDLSAAIWKVAQTQGYSGFIPEGRHTLLDDHLPFVRLGITAIDIIDFDYPYWHTTEDTLDKVSADSLEQVGRTLQIWLMENQPLANSSE